MDIILKNICKSYDGKTVLHNFSYIFPSGEITSLMAPSGWGKTTLLRIMLGLEFSDSGEIIYSKANNFKKSVIFQEDRLCENLSAISNIKLVTPSLSNELIVKEMTKVGLLDCGNQPVRELSGGMCRRIAILRALLAEYDVLFMDEPFKGLDDMTKNKVIEYTKKRCEGHTVIFITHDEKEVELLDVKNRISIL